MAPAGIINKETETIVATGVILAGIPTVDKIDIDKIKGGNRKFLILAMGVPR